MQWKKPPTGMSKINWDVIVDKNNGRIGLGIIARDCDGFILAAQSTTKNILIEHVMAKALAAAHAIDFSKELGFNDIILEGDAI